MMQIVGAILAQWPGLTPLRPHDLSRLAETGCSHQDEPFYRGYYLAVCLVGVALVVRLSG